MKKYFTIQQAAKIVNTTSETLRHYDRIGLVQPCHRDEASQYRYYSEQEIIRLQTIELLKCMDLTLSEIKEILQINDLSKVIMLLKEAEKHADQKIERLKYAKSKIRRAYVDYEKKLNGMDTQAGELFVRDLESRAILISDRLESATLKNLWSYHSHFYGQVGEEMRSQYQFEDGAGMIATPEKTRLFATCLKYPDLKELTVLPAGNYLCANCSEESRSEILKEALHRADREFGITPEVIIYHIVVTGILQWNYQIQIFVDGNILL